MATLLVIIAALLGSFSNFSLRKSIEVGGNAKSFLVIQLTISFLIASLLNFPGHTPLNWDEKSIGIGLGGGLLLGAMMWALGKALEKGPSGLTFAAHNSASIMPAIVMALCFGATCGHGYSIWNGLGSILVVGGLFWASLTPMDNKKQKGWILFAVFAVLLHVSYISYMQWRVLLLNSDFLSHRFIPFCLDPATNYWFMPMIFLAAAIVQIVIYFSQKPKLPTKNELIWGAIGGIANGGNLFCLVQATEKAAVWEKAMIFPISSVATILVCNLWAQKLYKESINWKANALCLLGIVVGLAL